MTNERVSYLAGMTELDFSEGVEWSELKAAFEVLQDQCAWLLERVNHYSGGLVDSVDVPLLEELRDLKWMQIRITRSCASLGEQE